MMRSANPSPSGKTRPIDHPFLILGAIALAALAALTWAEPPGGSVVGPVLENLWRWFGLIFRWSAELVPRMLPDLSSGMNLALVGLLGLLVHLLLDAIWRYLRLMKR